MSHCQTPAPPTRPGVDALITFFYYKDFDRAVRFYGETMGFELTVDQGWSKIFRVTGNAHMGVVDEKRGYHKANAIKPVELTLVVGDADAWYAYLTAQGVPTLNTPHDVPELALRLFLLQDPEGYVIEIQQFL
ncbi:MAG: VOC family protein [Chloroflexi bacterium]|nr:VOC family protein [Chloroflexota bacterium]